MSRAIFTRRSAEDARSLLHRRAADEIIEEMLGRGARIRFLTVGSSMRWLIPPGSEIEAEGRASSDMRTGDVVLYRFDVGPAVKFKAHRIVRIRRGSSGPRLFLKGDSSPRDPEWLETGDVVGVVTAVRTPGGLFRLDHPVWRSLNPVIAALSRLSAWFRDRMPAFVLRMRPPGHIVFPQTVLHALLRRLIRIGLAASRVSP